MNIIIFEKGFYEESMIFIILLPLVSNINNLQ